MKRQNTLLLFILFSLLPLPFVIGIFGSLESTGAIWDVISLIIVYVAAILLYLVTFKNTKKCSKNFFIYKLIWLQEMFILSGILGTFLGFIFIFQAMELDGVPGVDPAAALISNFAIAIITLLYGVLGASIIYFIQKYHEMRNDDSDSVEVIKPKEGFLFPSLLFFLIFVGLDVLAAFIGSEHTGGLSVLLQIESLIYILTVTIILILFYKGDSLINLIKNTFWYIPNKQKHIEYNLKYIRNMKKITAMFIIISLLCAPIVMLVAICCLPPEINNLGWNNTPFIGLKNGGIIFLWLLFIIIILTIIEGREASKLYFETGKISAGDRYYSLKYILAPAFLLFFTVSIGIMLSFIAL